MNHASRTHHHRRPARVPGLLSAGLGLVFTSLAVFAEPSPPVPTPPGLQMVVYTDTAQGRRLVEGDLEGAMDLGDPVQASRFETINNECVSLTLSGQFAAAEVACDEALSAARRSLQANAPRFSPQGVTGDIRTNRAMAFTNRGVLRALTGDRPGAREDFERATSLSDRVEAAFANLERLGPSRSIAQAK